MAQLVSAPPCHGGGRGFKSRQGRHLINFKSGQIAQSVERPPEKWKVSGSIPLLATINPQSGNGLGILCLPGVCRGDRRKAQCIEPYENIKVGEIKPRAHPSG